MGTQSPAPRGQAGHSPHSVLPQVGGQGERQGSLCKGEPGEEWGRGSHSEPGCRGISSLRVRTSEQSRVIPPGVQRSSECGSSCSCTEASGCPAGAQCRTGHSTGSQRPGPLPPRAHCHQGSQRLGPLGPPRGTGGSAGDHALVWLIHTQDKGWGEVPSTVSCRVTRRGHS